MSVIRLTIAVVLFTGSLQANGADIRPELESCRSIESLAYRLQCYDKLVDDLEASGLSTVVPDAPKRVTPQVVPLIVQPTAVQPSSSTTSSTTSAPASATSVAVTQPKAENKKAAAEELFGKRGDEVQEVVERELEIDSVDQIASEVTQVRLAPNKEYVVYLANGQVWRQKSKIGKWRIKVGERAIVSKASLGSFVMKSDTRKRSVKVERLR